MPRLEVRPASSRVDQPLTIRATGFAPADRVTLRASTRDGGHTEWASAATFLADPAGVVDPSVLAPVDGGYRDVDGTGLLWSMVPAEPALAVLFARRKNTPQQVVITAEHAADTHSVLASVAVERTFGGPDVVSRPAGGPELVGTLHYRSDRQPRPAVLVLGGSDGGQLDHAAALLAAHGYTVLALSYFGVEDRPSTLLRIELGYFASAIDWLLAQPEVTGDRLAVIGLSRGAELALQLGSMRPEIGAVVAGAPSSVRHAGLTRSYTDFTKPAWLAGGEPLPFLAGRTGPVSTLTTAARFLFRRPMRQRRGFEQAMRDQRRVAAASIAVERIHGPVLLISGGADQLWPSARFADQIMARLAEHGHPFPDQDLRYPDAGHFVCFPYALPTMPPMTTMSPVPALTIDFGGSTAGNAAAAADSFQHLLRFLDEFAGAGHRLPPAAGAPAGTGWR